MKLFQGMRGSMLIFSIIYVLISLILLVVSDASLLTISNIFAVLLILIIIFRRQGLTGGSEIIVESIFSKSTYTGLFKAETYRNLAEITKSKLTGGNKKK